MCVLGVEGRSSEEQAVPLTTPALTFIVTVLLCLNAQGPQHVCGGQRKTYRSWLCLSPMWVPGTEMVGLGSRCFYLLLTHLDEATL